MSINLLEENIELFFQPVRTADLTAERFEAEKRLIKAERIKLPLSLVNHIFGGN